MSWGGLRLFSPQTPPLLRKSDNTFIIKSKICKKIGCGLSRRGNCKTWCNKGVSLSSNVITISYWSLIKIQKYFWTKKELNVCLVPTFITYKIKSRTYCIVPAKHRSAIFGNILRDFFLNLEIFVTPWELSSYDTSTFSFCLTPVEGS